MNPETLSADVIVDCLGKLCPIPVTETSKAIRRMEVGHILLLVADDPGSDPDIHAWCDETDNTLLRMEQDGKVFRFWIRH